ncbi:MAG: hypothetical protein FWG82_00135 [Oscillospiraceae bacterium]|nr:hypothetical protein [Oscillospiraceae bacterium]
MKKALRIILCIGLVGAVIAASLLISYGRDENHRYEISDNADDYSRIMSENIQGNPRVVDIAMLGSHDAFSDKITRKSAVDPNNSIAKLMPVIMPFWGGVFARKNKAQHSDGYEQAVRGARYFDVRVVWQGGQWQNFHSFISEPYENNLRHMIRFLSENPGELIIFDIQHHFPMENTSAMMLEFMGEITYEGKSIWDFVRFDPTQIPLGELTYEQATNGGGGIVVLVKIPQSEGCKYYQYNSETMRSNWHNKSTGREIIQGIEAEYAYLRENFETHKDAFRVNQAQTTPGMSLEYWSLLHDADRSNVMMVTHPDFSAWLEVMPIFMVNNIDSSAESFNAAAMEAINKFNRGLN